MSTTETGHAKNIASFRQLIAFCASYGADYNPSRPALTVKSLQQLLAAAADQLQQVKVAHTAYIHAVNQRQLAFKSLRPTVTKVIAALSASGAGSLAVADARTIARKLQGKRAPSSNPQQDPATPANTISVSQLSFDSRIDHFTKLIVLVSQQPGYAPNEPGLQVEGLSNMLTQLQTANTNVINRFTDLSNSRISRMHILYNPETGLIPLGLSVREYIKSRYGYSSPQYIQVQSVHLHNLINS